MDIFKDVIFTEKRLNVIEKCLNTLCMTWTPKNENNSKKSADSWNLKKGKH